VVIIDDDDPLRTLSVADAQVTEGDTPDTTTLDFILQLDGPADGNEVVTVSTTDGSATAPDDYLAVPPTPVAFAPGQQSATVSVTVIGDVLDEGNHSFTLNVANPQNVVIAPGSATAIGTIIDDDQTREIVAVSNPEVLEGDVGTTTMTFVLTLDQPAKGTERVRVDTDVPMTSPATPDVDFVAITDGLVEFVAGEMTAEVDVTVNGDLDIELDEYLLLELSEPQSVTIGDASGLGLIRNDDGVIAVSISDVALPEGDVGTTTFSFALTLAEPAVGGESLTVTTSDGTATVADGDYVARTDTLTFAPDATSVSFDVVVNGDTDVEPDETFFVTLSSPSGLLIIDGTGLGTIQNDDVPRRRSRSRTHPSRKVTSARRSCR
jgi:hypothetical protein